MIIISAILSLTFFGYTSYNKYYELKELEIDQIFDEEVNNMMTKECPILMEMILEFNLLGVINTWRLQRVKQVQYLADFSRLAPSQEPCFESTKNLNEIDIIFGSRFFLRVGPRPGSKPLAVILLATIKPSNRNK